MVSYNIQRYHNDTEYRKRIRAIEKSRFDRWLKNNPDYHKEYYQRNKEHMNQQAHEYHKDTIETLRDKLIIIINKSLFIGCSVCNSTDQLAIHHINFNGKADRQRFPIGSSSKDYNKIGWLKHMIEHYHEEKSIYPLQVLCENCHKNIHKH